MTVDEALDADAWMLTTNLVEGNEDRALVEEVIVTLVAEVRRLWAELDYMQEDCARHHVRTEG